MELGVVGGANGSSGSGVFRKECCRCIDRGVASGIRVSRGASEMTELGVVGVAVGNLDQEFLGKNVVVVLTVVVLPEEQFLGTNDVVF